MKHITIAITLLGAACSTYDSSRLEQTAEAAEVGTGDGCPIGQVLGRDVLGTRVFFSDLPMDSLVSATARCVSDTEVSCAFWQEGPDAFRWHEHVPDCLSEPILSTGSGNPKWSDHDNPRLFTFLLPMWTEKITLAAGTAKCTDRDPATLKNLCPAASASTAMPPAVANHFAGLAGEGVLNAQLYKCCIKDPG